jgi:hypothetical protein
MKLIFSILLLFCLTTVNSQIVYSYIDPCTGTLKQLNVPDNGITVTYFNQIKTFSKIDFQNGNFESWASGVVSKFGDNNPCGSTIGVSSAVNIAQSSALNVIGILNSLSVVADIQSSSSELGGGMLDVTSGVMGSSNSTSKKEDKKNNTTLGIQSSNESGSNSQQTNNIQNQSDQNNSSQTANTQMRSETVSENGNSSNSNLSSNSNSENNGTVSSNNNQSSEGNAQSNSGNNGSGTTQNSNSSTNSSANVQGGNSGTTNQSTESGGNQTQSSVENKSADNTTTETTSTGNSNTNTTNSESEQKTPDQNTDANTNTEKKSSNLLGGAVSSIANSSGKSEGNKPTVVLSSDFTGFNFKNNDVVYGGKATGGFTSMRWDGRRTHGFLVDYTTVSKGPNMTSFYAFVNKKRIDLISVTGTASFYGKGSLYGTIALGQMWSIKNKTKVLYLMTTSWGQVYQEKFLGTAFITGGMHDWKVAKRLDIKMMGLFIYAPFVSYYNDLVLKSPYVVMPVLGTNIGITKKFKLNINMSGTYAIKEDVLNFTIMLGTRFAL